MRKNRVSFFIAIVLAMFAANPGAPALQSNTVSAQPPIENVRDIPIDAVFYNPCCDEEVHVFGTAHILITKNVIHIGVSDVTGVGLESGYSYTGRGTSVETNVFYSSQFDGTLSFHQNLTNSNGCSFKVKLLLHVTSNANGDVTAEVENVRAFCGGRSGS